MSELNSSFEIINTKNWKQLANSIIFIQCSQRIEDLKKAGFELDPKDDGFLALCYIDYEKGLCFSVVAGAHIESDNEKMGIIYSKINDKQFFYYTYDELQNCPFLNQDIIEIQLETFLPDALYIIETFEKPYQEAVEMREIQELDNFRNPVKPDEVQVLILGENIKAEHVWVRCTRFGEKCLFGKILDEPSSATGFKKGDELDFIVVQKDNILLAVHII